MDTKYLQAVEQTVYLAFQLAAIERALEVAEEKQEWRFLPDTIRMCIASAECMAGDDLAICRRTIRSEKERSSDETPFQAR